MSTRRLTILAGALLLACASVPLAPSEEDLRARQLQPPEGKALVYVFRDGLMAATSTFQLWADGERVGELASGTYLVLEVEPGPHRLAFPFNDGASTLALRVEAGRRYFVRQWLQRIPALLVAIDTAKLGEVDAQEGAGALGHLVRVVTLRPHAEEDRQARLARPEADGALVYVLRWPWAAPRSDFEVEVGGRPAGRLAARAFLVAEVRPGPVVVTAKGANEASLTLQLPPGGAAYVALVPRMGWTTPRVELAQVEEGRGRASLDELRVVNWLRPAAPP